MSKTLKNGLPESKAQRYAAFLRKVDKSIQPERKTISRTYNILKPRYGGTEYCHIGIEQFAGLDKLLFGLAAKFPMSRNTTTREVCFSIGIENIPKELCSFPEIVAGKWIKGVYKNLGVYTSNGNLYISMDLFDFQKKYVYSVEFSEQPCGGRNGMGFGYYHQYYRRARYYWCKGGIKPNVLDEDLGYWDGLGIIKKRNHLKQNILLQDWM